jgi:hypothetical protein
LKWVHKNIQSWRFIELIRYKYGGIKVLGIYGQYEPSAIQHAQGLIPFLRWARCLFRNSDVCGTPEKKQRRDKGEPQTGPMNVVYDEI